MRRLLELYPPGATPSTFITDEVDRTHHTIEQLLALLTLIDDDDGIEDVLDQVEYALGLMQCELDDCAHVTRNLARSLPS